MSEGEDPRCDMEFYVPYNINGTYEQQLTAYKTSAMVVEIPHRPSGARAAARFNLKLVHVVSVSPLLLGSLCERIDADRR